jgi:hypothetical protein
MTARTVVVLSLVLVMLAGLPALAAVPQGGAKDLKAKVKNLLHEMENGTTAAKLAAEWELLKLGADALSCLPSPETTPAGLKERLVLIRATLAELQPRLWMPERKEMSLKEALQRLQKHTGLTVVDRRQGGGDPQVPVPTRPVTFWEAAHALAAQCKGRLSLYQQDGQIALVDGPAGPLPLSFAGPFRVAVKGVRAALDLDAKTHVCVVTLEVAWEPRFSPFLVEAGRASLRAGPAFVAEFAPHGPVQVVEKNAKEFDLLFAAPPRAAGAIDELRGRFIITTPSKTHTFTFKKPKEKPKQEEGGIQVAITDVVMEPASWTVELAIDYPPAGPRYESFQTWLGSKPWLDNNSCYFERGAGENRETLRPDPLHTQIVRATPTRVVVRYRFSGNNAGPAGLQNFDSWKLICRTPGRMVEVTVPYSFKDVALP